MTGRRVLLVVAADSTLRESADVLATTGRSVGLPKAPLSVSDDIKLDLNFTPVPIASIGFTSNMALATPQQAPHFVVRGEIDAPAGKEIPRQVGAANVFADPAIASCAPGCDPKPIGTVADVQRLLEVEALHKMNLDGRHTAVAIMDTGINLAHLRGRGLDPHVDDSLTLSPGFGRPGEYAVQHGTMCAYDVLVSAPKTTLLDFPVLLSAGSGGKDMQGVLSDALQAYNVLYTFLRQPPPSRPYQSMIVSNSWAMYHQSWDFPPGHPGRYADNPNHPFNLMVGTVARAGADILFVAGNCGADCPDDRCRGVTEGSIMGANAHPETITVAGVAIDGARVGFSSQGPGIPGMAYAKPDLSAYTHFLGSEVFGPGSPDSGTSAACPVAAGAITALRSAIPLDAVAPRDLLRELCHDAANPVPGGWNRDFGHGIISPLNTARRMLGSA